MVHGSWFMAQRSWLMAGAGPAPGILSGNQIRRPLQDVERVRVHGKFDFGTTGVRFLRTTCRFKR